MLLSLIFCPVDHSIDVGVGLHLGTVKVQFLSPYQSGFDAQFHNVLKEPLKDLQSKPLSDLAQATVIGDWLIQVIADEPAMCQVEIDSLHQLSFRADPFEKADQLKLEENHWINRGTSDV